MEEEMLLENDIDLGVFAEYYHIVKPNDVIDEEYTKEDYISDVQQVEDAIKSTYGDDAEYVGMAIANDDVFDALESAGYEYLDFLKSSNGIVPFQTNKQGGCEEISIDDVRTKVNGEWYDRPETPIEEHIDIYVKAPGEHASEETETHRFDTIEKAKNWIKRFDIKRDDVVKYQNISDDEINSVLTECNKRLTSNKLCDKIKAQTKLKEEFNLKDTLLAVWNWANYNGDDDAPGCTTFVSTDEARKYANKYEEYEPFCPDLDNNNGFPIEGTLEYYNIDELCDKLDKWNVLDDYTRKVASALIDYGKDFDDAIDGADDVFVIEANDDTELAYEYISDVYGDVENLDKETLEQYIDWDEVKRIEMQDNDDYYRDIYEEENGSEYDEDDFREFKEQLVDEFIAETEASPSDYISNIDFYFDFERFGRELSWDAVKGDGVYIFNV